MAVVLGVMAASIFSGSKLKVLGWMSANIGVQFSHLMALQVAIQLKGVVMTSPLHSKALNAKCKAMVPLEFAVK